MNRIFAFLSIALLGCNSQVSPLPKKAIPPQFLPQEIKEERYRQVKQSILTLRDSLHGEIHSDPSKSQLILHFAQNALTTYLRDSVFPFWMETKWDYNGTSETPGKGAIACGYFVTTCLRDCGLKVERVKLAQQTALRIMNTVCDMSQLRRIGHNNFDKLNRHIKSQKDGVFIIGLDNHVGFIVKSENDILMVHSNGFRGHSKVETESLLDCDLVVRSQNYFIAPLFTDQSITMKWINSSPVPLNL